MAHAHGRGALRSRSPRALSNSRAEVLGSEAHQSAQTRLQRRPEPGPSLRRLFLSPRPTYGMLLAAWLLAFAAPRESRRKEIRHATGAGSDREDKQSEKEPVAQRELRAVERAVRDGVQQRADTVSRRASGG